MHICHGAVCGGRTQILEWFPFLNDACWSRAAPLALSTIPQVIHRPRS